MHRWALCFCLLTTLTGSSLRHAEAAGDLARSLGELAQETTVEEVDGGVGDDLGVAAFRAGNQLDASHSRDRTSAGHLAPMTLVSSSWPDVCTGKHRRYRESWMPDPAQRRRARLQRFLF